MEEKVINIEIKSLEKIEKEEQKPIDKVFVSEIQTFKEIEKEEKVEIKNWSSDKSITIEEKRKEIKLKLSQFSKFLNKNKKMYDRETRVEVIQTVKMMFEVERFDLIDLIEKVNGLFVTFNFDERVT